MSAAIREIQPFVEVFRSDNTQIFCGDYRDVLPALPKFCADLLIADVPYGQGYKGTGFRTLQLTEMEIAQDNGEFDIIEFINHALHVVREMRHLYVFGPYDLNPHPQLAGVTELIWDKEQMSAGDLSSLWSTTHEKVTFAINGRRLGKAAKVRGNLAGRLRRSSVLRCPRLNASGVDSHLTEKPVMLLRGLIESSSYIGETVIDPCMGTGSTLEAALIEGRKAIGVDISRRNCDEAVQRLRKAGLLQ